MKEEYIEIANETFQDYNIKITTDGHCPRGAVVGSNENKEEFVIAKVSVWVKQLEVLTNFACPEPHAAVSGFIHGLRHRYPYFMRTIPGISLLLKPLDDAIDIFIKVLLQGYAFNPTECVLFSLPAKYCGMGLVISLEICQEESTNKVIRNEIQFQNNGLSTAKKTKKKTSNTKKKKNLNDAKLQEVTNKTSCKPKLRSTEASTENGASI